MYHIEQAAIFDDYDTVSCSDEINTVPDLPALRKAHRKGGCTASFRSVLNHRPFPCKQEVGKGSCLLDKPGVVGGCCLGKSGCGEVLCISRLNFMTNVLCRKESSQLFFCYKSVFTTKTIYCSISSQIFSCLRSDLVTIIIYS